jgi:hypothetical protein
MNRAPANLSPESLPRPGEVALLTAISAILDVSADELPAGSLSPGAMSAPRSMRSPARAASRTRWSRRCWLLTPAGTPWTTAMISHRDDRVPAMSQAELLVARFTGQRKGPQSATTEANRSANSGSSGRSSTGASAAAQPWQNSDSPSCTTNPRSASCARAVSSIRRSPR